MHKTLILGLILLLSACAGMKIPYMSDDPEPPYPYDMAIRSAGWPCEIVGFSSNEGKEYKIAEVTCQDDNDKMTLRNTSEVS